MREDSVGNGYRVSPKRSEGREFCEGHRLLKDSGTGKASSRFGTLKEWTEETPTPIESSRRDSSGSPEHRPLRAWLAVRRVP